MDDNIMWAIVSARDIVADSTSAAFLAAQDRYRAARDAEEADADRHLQIYWQSWNAWMAELLARFGGMPTRDETDRLFNMPLEVDLGKPASFEGFSEALIPIAVLRTLVAQHRVPFHMRHMPCFVTFAERYRDAIMS